MLKPVALQSLRQVVDPRRIITDPGELMVFEMDATWERGVPDAVVFPKSAAELAQLMRWATAQRVPIVARGAGTGLSGGAIAEHGGVIVEFSNFDRIVEFDPLGRSVVVETGIVNAVLDAFVKSKGLYYPPDPASGRSATIGGNVAENAGGPHCFKYGVTSNYVTGLQVVLADGRILHFGGRALDYPEYDLSALLTGSEGTLGLITQMEARLICNPPSVKTAMAAFESPERAGQAVSAVIAAGLVPATMEMLDQKVMRIVEDFSHAGLPVHAGAMLIAEVDGYAASLDSQMDEIVQTLEQNGAFDVRVAQSAEERERIWYGRKSTAGAFAKLAPAKFTVDCTVPRSQLADTLREISEICAQRDLQVGYILHAGDGNLHPNIPYAPSDRDQFARGVEACEAMMRAVVARGGSITGEHGVGIEKREYMAFMCDGAELGTMWDVKETFDPQHLLNPAKIFPKQMPAINKVTPLAQAPSDPFLPRSGEETAAGLAALAAAKQPVAVNAKRAGALTLSTRNLVDILHYAPEDLYITVGAGATLDDVQTFLAQHGQQIALASPWRDTTLGAIVNVNLNSPQRMRYGAVRDQLLCATVALSDGRLVRAGRVVVKNVAGYDLPKAFVGAYGTLGVLTDVTFKLMPLPRSKRTLLVPIPDLKQGLAIGAQLLPHALVASALVLAKGVAIPGLSSDLVLVYTAEGVAQDVEAELANVRAVLQKANVVAREVATPTGTDVWCELQRRATPHAINVRVGVAPKDVARYVAAPAATMDAGAYLVDIANGMVYVIGLPKTIEAAQTWLAALREPARALGGYAVATFVPAEWSGAINRWGDAPEALELMRALKARWDPANILGVGEFII